MIAADASFRTRSLLAVALAAVPVLTRAQAEFIFGSGFEQVASIDAIQRQFVAAGTSVALGPVYVTGVRTTSGNTTFFIQTPDVAAASADHPQYAGIKVFASPAIPGVTIGDCVLLEGVVTEFQGATEISPMSSYATLPQAACGSPFPAPAEVLVAAIASDVDPVTAGNQPGTLAEAYEGVQVRVSSVAVAEVFPSGRFSVRRDIPPAPSPPERLVIGNLLFTVPAAQGQVFSSITGVLDQQQADLFEYRLLPRGTSDAAQ
jgi:predicted extracellular nuclease